MRRLYLRGRDNIAKRVLIHAAGFNVGLMMRVKYGLRKPRSGSGVVAVVCALIFALVRRLRPLGTILRTIAAPGRLLATASQPSSLAFAT